MAVPNEGYGAFRQYLWRHFKVDLKAAGMFNKTQLRAAADAIDNHWEDGLAKVKSDLEIALGVSLTAAQAKTVAKAWMLWKAGTY